MEQRIANHLRELGILLRDADDRLDGGYDMEPWQRKQARKRRNAINAACNAMYRATVA